MNTILTIYNLDVMVYSLQTHQRKLLSLCIATLNDPDILILDDPTSGTDPLYKLVEFIEFNLNESIFVKFNFFVGTMFG